jgi:hypothetical protein
MLEKQCSTFHADVLLIKLMIQPTKAVVDIMENLFFLVVAAILLAVSVYF